MASEKSLPATMVAKGTDVGKRIGYGDPRPTAPPSWPRLSRPQPHRPPDSSRASEWFRPAATATMSRTLYVTGLGACGAMSIGAALPNRPPRGSPQDSTWPSEVTASACDVPQLTSVTVAGSTGRTAASFGAGVVATPSWLDSFAPQAVAPPCASTMTVKDSPDDAAATGPGTPATGRGGIGLVTNDSIASSPHCHTVPSASSAAMWLTPGQNRTNSSGTGGPGGNSGATGSVRARNGEDAGADGIFGMVGGLTGILGIAGIFGIAGTFGMVGGLTAPGPRFLTAPAGASSIFPIASSTSSSAISAPSAAAVSGSWAKVSLAMGARAGPRTGTWAPPPMTKHPTEPFAGSPASDSVRASSARAPADQSARMRSRSARVSRTVPCPRSVVTAISVSGSRARSSLARRTSSRRDASSVRLVSARRAAAKGGLSRSRNAPSHARIRASTSSPPSVRSE